GSLEQRLRRGGQGWPARGYDSSAARTQSGSLPARWRRRDGSQQRRRRCVSHPRSPNCRHGYGLLGQLTIRGVNQGLRSGRSLGVSSRRRALATSQGHGVAIQPDRDLLSEPARRWENLQPVEKHYGYAILKTAEGLD